MTACPLDLWRRYLDAESAENFGMVLRSCGPKTVRYRFGNSGKRCTAERRQVI